MDSTQVATSLHGHHHDDYEQAKREIYQMLGSVDDLEIWGEHVLVAQYVRPNVTKNGLCLTSKSQFEDAHVGKAVMVVKLGPDAFQGTEGWLKAKFGSRPPPEPGDWCFLREDVGVPVQFCGDGAEPVMAKDSVGREKEAYAWRGWPCRIVHHESFIGRINKPHQIV
jgi:hypothetical protein